MKLRDTYVITLRVDCALQTLMAPLCGSVMLTIFTRYIFTEVRANLQSQFDVVCIAAVLVRVFWT